MTSHPMPYSRRKYFFCDMELEGGIQRLYNMLWILESHKD